MRIAVLVLALMVIPAMRCHGGSISDIPADRCVVLTSSPESKWTPTTAQTKECLRGLQAYLEKSSDEKNVDPVLTAGSEGRSKWIASQIREILGNKEGYRVQFWGTTEENQAVVYCNLFLARSGDPKEFAYWKKQRVLVMDGGSAFWFATYNLKTKSVVMFQSNGVASKCSPSFRARMFFADRSL